MNALLQSLRMNKIALTLLVLALGSADALELSEVQGLAEISSGGAWTSASAGPLAGGVRTRVGRAVVLDGAGRFTLGPQSQLELRQGEVALTTGQGYLEGPLSGYAGPHHFRLERGSRARMDYVGPVSRLAVLSGSVNFYNAASKKSVAIPAGQALNLRSFALSGFTEEAQPWYAQKLAGLGAVRLEASKGTVQTLLGGAWQGMGRGDALEGEGAVRTGEASWAELGFEGGGYLRLGEKALLRVLGLEKLADGKRKVLLSLEQGSVWNVVQKGKGGYELRTATLVAGVRGTVFRLDADGLLKVLEGEVAASGAAGDQAVAQGQQLENGKKALLVLDAQDHFNLERDRLKAAPLSLEGGFEAVGAALTAPVQPGVDARLARGFARAVMLKLQTNPDSRVTLRIIRRGGAAQTLSLVPDAEGRVRFQPPLTEGEVTLELSVQHEAEQKTEARTFRIDRTAPRIALERLRRDGDALVLNLEVADASPVALELRDAAGRALTYTGSLESGALRFPQFASSSGPFELILTDAAGNRTVQRLDLDAGY